MKAIIDVREWQTTVDMETGYPCAADFQDHAALSAIASRHPYPGDRGNQGVRWVFEVTREITAIHEPDLLCLTFPQLVIAGKHRLLAAEEKAAMLHEITDGIADLAAKLGLETVIVGGGALAPLQGYIMPAAIGGLFQGTAWSNIYAGVYKADEGDFERVRAMEDVSFIVKKEEILPRCCNDSFMSQLPDILIGAKKGFAFKALGSANNPLCAVEQENDYLPVYSEIGTPAHIESVRSMMDAALDKGKKVLLAIIEGVDCEDFENVAVPNRRDWFTYSGSWLYYTLATGKPFYSFSLPPVFNMARDSGFPVRYPFSLSALKPCDDSIGCRPDKYSVCVGGRSLTSHTMFNCDINAECFVRSMINMGMMITVR